MPATRPSRVVIVGGGVLGTMHALAAHRRGHTVVQLEADAAPRRASVRNFGLVWVSGRAPGAELALALRSRELWERIAHDVPGVGFRPDGSLTVARDAAERRVLEEAAAAPDAGARGFELLDADGARRCNPALGGRVEAALRCTRDAIVEPGAVLPALHGHLAGRGRYELHTGCTVVDVDERGVRDHVGRRFDGDLVVLCPGAAYTGPGAEAFARAPLRRCRLQMMQTEPAPFRLTTALADGDSLRYYPAFRLPALAGLEPQPPVAAAHHMQLLVAQRASGALTIGDTHAYDEPFDFAVEEAPYDHLRARAEEILGVPLPPVVRRWAGVYSQRTDDGIVWRERVAPSVVAVTGAGGRGMTLSAALGEETFEELDG